jgi:AraC family transcriptional regulator, transcriptional activator FtrA
MHANTAKPGSRSKRARAVAVLAYDGVAMFELGVACDILGSGMGQLVDPPWYELSLCAAAPGLLSSDAGFGIEVPHGIDRIRRAGTIVVSPTDYPDEVPLAILEELWRAHRRGQRIVSLCTGAFVLARAGVLDGRRATTHWAECETLARQYPLVEVDPNVLYVDEGDLLTSAGSAASIDLLLHIVRLDYGTEIANRVARDLVVPPHRDGDQAQYIDTPMPSYAGADLFTETLGWAQSHVDESVTIDDLAARSAMSPRTFVRRFGETTGTTPYKWLLQQRVERAQRLLETTDLSIDIVAARSGFGTADNLRKHFRRTVHTSPNSYRRTFAART